MNHNLAIIAGKYHQCAWTTISAVAICCLAAGTLSAEPSKKRPRTLSSSPYANSDILASNGDHTIVPQGAVLAVPSRLTAKVVTKPTGDFVPWQKFVQKNYSWILKKEVNFDQASGKNPLTEDQMLRLQKSGKVVVAVMKNNPISVKRIETQETTP